MLKEYRSIAEVAGPLMLVRGVEGVTFNELGEIELANGEIRRCRVLEVDGSNALVQLLKAPQASMWPLVRYVFWEETLNFPYPRIYWAVFLTDWAVPSTEVRPSSPIRGWT